MIYIIVSSDLRVTIVKIYTYYNKTVESMCLLLLMSKTSQRTCIGFSQLNWASPETNLGPYFVMSEWRGECYEKYSTRAKPRAQLVTDKLIMHQSEIEMSASISDITRNVIYIIWYDNSTVCIIYGRRPWRRRRRNSTYMKCARLWRNTVWYIITRDMHL